MARPRIALAQFGGTYETEKNVARASDLARQAARAGANLVCFPELSNTVYMAWENDPRHFAKAEPVPGPSTEAMQAVARATGMMIVYPLFERDGQRYYNTAVVLDTHGRISGKYRKTSVPSARLFPAGVETFYFAPGDLPFRIFHTPFGFTFGIIICYERNLSEPARCVALAGADLLLCPVATTDVVRPWWEVLLRAHAIQNVMYVGACNKVGIEDGGAPGVAYFGTSLFVDPRGDVLARASESDDQVITEEIDLDLLAAQRERWCFLRDRRPDLYGAITRAPRLPVASEGS